MEGGQFFESYPMVELDSDDDDESCTSSEDEIDVLLAGRQRQNEQLKKKSTDRKSSSSEDDFEKEMAAELDQRMASIESMQKGSQSVFSSMKKESTKKENFHKTTQQKYEDEFLDSIDRSDDEDSKPGAPGQSQPSNDELLYDPDMDDEDQKWVDKQRQSYQLKPSGKASKRQYTSDAVLCCPACMVCLCRDCQRHATYKNQFRAMFVMNCSVDKTEVMKYPTQNNKKKNKSKKKKTKQSEGTSNENQTESDNVTAANIDSEVYHPVRCDQCTTEVGVFDSDEIFHFFNVIESNG